MFTGKMERLVFLKHESYSRINDQLAFALKYFNLEVLRSLQKRRRKCVKLNFIREKF